MNVNGDKLKTIQRGSSYPFKSFSVVRNPTKENKKIFVITENTEKEKVSLSIYNPENNETVKCQILFEILNVFCPLQNSLVTVNGNHLSLLHFTKSDYCHEKIEFHFQNFFEVFECENLFLIRDKNLVLVFQNRIEVYSINYSI